MVYLVIGIISIIIGGLGWFIWEILEAGSLDHPTYIAFRDTKEPFDE